MPSKPRRGEKDYTPINASTIREWAKACEELRERLADCADQFESLQIKEFAAPIGNLKNATTSIHNWINSYLIPRILTGAQERGLKIAVTMTKEEHKRQSK